MIEAKSGAVSSNAHRQIEEYALLLHYFHKASSGKLIVPIVVSDSVPVDEEMVLPVQTSPIPSVKVIRSSWSSLASKLIHLDGISHSQITPEAWDASPYFPVPTIIEAAVALRTGLSIREIAHSEASEHEIGLVQDTIQSIVDNARREGLHAICFLTGVPGSGKTLVGLSLAHSDKSKSHAIHFMSGNGPLVKVLQHLFKTEGMRAGASSNDAKLESETLIENVHVFASHYTKKDDSRPPSNHAMIFDEAQRAWNKAQNLKKFKRDYSEPEMILRIMERHEDWAVVIALVGGGQEINDGEAGLSEWGKALLCSKRKWVVYASPEVLSGGPSTAGQQLFAQPTYAQNVEKNEALHLRTSNRSLRAENLAEWVNHVLTGDDGSAASLKIGERFPILLSRNLSQTRKLLQDRRVGASRFGLVGSSGATRLRAEGLEPSSTFHAEYPWKYWYLSEASDIRSSFRCEVFATEFEVQGLELDWVGLCWGGDFIWDETRNEWLIRSLRHGPLSKWSPIKKNEKRTYRRNAYRVLLTRARQGIVIFVPTGNLDDPTLSSSEFDATASFLVRCGATPVNHHP